MAMASPKPESKTSTEDAEQQTQTFVRLQNVAGDEIRVPVDPEKIKTIADLCSWEIIRGLFREDQLRPPTHRLLWRKVREEYADGRADEGEDQGDDIDDDELRARCSAADDTEEFLARDAEVEHDSEGARVAYQLVVTAARDWDDVLRKELPLPVYEDEDVSERPVGFGKFHYYYRTFLKCFVRCISCLDDARDFIYDEAYMTPGLGVVSPDNLRDMVLRAVLYESLPWLTNAPDSGRLRQRGQMCRQEADVDIGSNHIRLLPWKIMCAAVELESVDWALHTKAVGARLGVTVEPEDRRSFGKRVLECVWQYGLLSDRDVCTRERVLEGDSYNAKDSVAALVVATLDACQLSGESLADVLFSSWEPYNAGLRFTFQSEPEQGDLAIPPVAVIEWLHDKMGEREVLAFLGKMGVLLSPDRLVDSARKDVEYDEYRRFSQYPDPWMKAVEEFSEDVRDRAEYAIAAIQLFLGCASSLGLSRGLCASVRVGLKRLVHSLKSRAVLEASCRAARALADARAFAAGADRTGAARQELFPTWCPRSCIGCFAHVVLGINGSVPGRAH